MHTMTAKSTAEAIRQATRSRIAAAIVDTRFADRSMDGLELALNLRDCDRSLPVWLADPGKRYKRDSGQVSAEGSVRRLFTGGRSTRDLIRIFESARSRAARGGN